MKKLLSLAGIALALGLPLEADDKTVRDANGRIIATVRDTATGSVVRDSSGQIVARVQETATGKTVRDASGKRIGTIEKKK